MAIFSLSFPTISGPVPILDCISAELVDFVVQAVVKLIIAGIVHVAIDRICVVFLTSITPSVIGTGNATCFGLGLGLSKNSKGIHKALCLNFESV